MHSYGALTPGRKRYGALTPGRKVVTPRRYGDKTPPYYGGYGGQPRYRRYASPRVVPYVRPLTSADLTLNHRSKEQIRLAFNRFDKNGDHVLSRHDFNGDGFRRLQRALGNEWRENITLEKFAEKLKQAAFREVPRRVAGSGLEDIVRNANHSLNTWVQHITQEVLDYVAPKKACAKCVGKGRLRGTLWGYNTCHRCGGSGLVDARPKQNGYKYGR